MIVLLEYNCFAGNFDAVRNLVKRRVPWLERHIEFKKIESDNDCFTLSSKDNKLIIEANNNNSASVGVNWYLKYYCNRSISHMGSNISPVDELPKIQKPQTVCSSALYRYALNYCTYNYTMSFYSWKDWEWELDWMAMNGVNLMLVANGAEAVWQNTLRRLNYTEKEIMDFLPGPAYNAWWLMGNLEGCGGPMSQNQIDRRAELAKKIINRMKELGIEPLLPGFYGMVPNRMKEKSNAKIINQGKWWAFSRPDILDPTDPEFTRIAGIFYEETAKLYGNDIKFFSGDPFHEGGTSRGISLGDAGLIVQKSMQKYFPGSVWVLQGWQGNPSSELLDKLDKKYVLVQELFGEYTNDWEKRKGYEGTPFIWGTVTNFGERLGLHARLQRFADEVFKATNGEYSHLMKGVGVLPEGLNNNPVAYELLLETVWHKDCIDVKKWIEGYISARYGKTTDNVSKAWQLLLNTVYSSTLGYQPGGAPENVLCARPSLNIKFVSSWGTVDKKYDKELYKKAVKLLANEYKEFSTVRTYKIDLIDFLRQYIANEADSVYKKIVDSYHSNDIISFDENIGIFNRMIDIENELLSHDPFYRLSTYQNQAIKSGKSKIEKDTNIRNLMTIITFWGGDEPSMLHDYAYKEWAGMMASFYKERWNIFFEYLKGKMINDDVTSPDFFKWENDWVNKNLKVINDKPEKSFNEVLNDIISL